MRSRLLLSIALLSTVMAVAADCHSEDEPTVAIGSTGLHVSVPAGFVMREVRSAAVNSESVARYRISPVESPPSAADGFLISVFPVSYPHEESFRSDLEGAVGEISDAYSRSGLNQVVFESTSVDQTDAVKLRLIGDGRLVQGLFLVLDDGRVVVVFGDERLKDKSDDQLTAAYEHIARTFKVR